MFGAPGQRSFASSPDDYVGFSVSAYVDSIESSKPQFFRTLYHLSDFTSAAPYDGESCDGGGRG